MKKLRRQHIDFEQIGRFLASAEKKLTAARKTLSIDEETAYQLAYESMLKGSLGFMLSLGFWPRSLPGHHVTETCDEQNVDKILNSSTLPSCMPQSRPETAFALEIKSLPDQQMLLVGHET